MGTCGGSPSCAGNSCSGIIWNYSGSPRRPIGQGLGGRLLSHVESLTFARANNMFACVSDFNDGARAFYRKQGYKEIGPMPNFLIPGYAEILLRKTTGPARTT
jgi:ribosomal protein S18 acetylase RimI-like enzyme